LQPGFIVTDAHEERHLFGASSKEEQKKWVACLRGLTSLNDSVSSPGQRFAEVGETLEDGQVMAMQSPHPAFMLVFEASRPVSGRPAE
jgi:hypothetical protein